MPDNEKERRIKKFLESLEAFQLSCKQLDHHAGELLEIFREEADRNVQK